jgi:glycogen(starch) synthase
MTRLLVLTQSELTRDPRARRAALEGRRRGFEVVGLCVEPGEPIALDGVPVVRLGGERISSGLRSAGLGGMRRNRPVVRELRGLFRLVRLAATTWRLAHRARRLGDFDIVHANDLDTLPAAWLASRRDGTRLVYDSHEIYADQEPDPPRIFRRVALALERATARRADAVVTVSEPIADELRRTLGLRRPVIAWLNCPERSGGDPQAAEPGALRAVYQGAMGPGRPLADLLDAAAHGEGFELALRVVGVDEQALRQEIAARGLEGRVRLEAPVAPDRLVEALGEFEVGLIINRPVTRNDELVFPNKLFEYLMAGLAVVVPRLPGLAPLVEGEGIGVTFEPGRPDLLGRALQELAADPDRVQELRRRARALALDRLNAETQRERLAAAWGL